MPTVSPKSYRYSPFVREGQLAGSTATKRVDDRPAKRSRRNGKAMPEKLDPPPAQPITTSGPSSAICIWVIASCPTIVWCRSTWLSTLPSAYLVSSLVAATSTASLMAIPRLPVDSGSASRMARPAFVSVDGDGTIEAP